MPTFSTPTPIDLAIKLPVGRIEVFASDRTDTVVTVSPTNPAKAVDVRGADETKVEFDGQRLTVTGPRPRFSFVGPFESQDVKVELPIGSRLTAETSSGGVHSVGRLGATRVKSSMVELDSTGDLWVRAMNGNVTVAKADGGVEITADHGQIRIGTVTGDAILKASHGSVTVGESSGDLEARLSYGDLEITKALASVEAKTAYGSIQLSEVSSGSVQVESGYGQVTVGVQPGVPAWLDLSSKNGHVRNGLDGDRAPAASEQTVEVRVRTQYGDITIQRAVEL
jgi:Putative adhesin